MSPRSMTLREYSQFGPVGGGLCSQFRGAQGELELIQDRQGGGRAEGGTALGQPARRLRYAYVVCLNRARSSATGICSTISIPNPSKPATLRG